MFKPHSYLAEVVPPPHLLFTPQTSSLMLLLVTMVELLRIATPRTRGRDLMVAIKIQSTFLLFHHTPLSIYKADNDCPVILPYYSTNLTKIVSSYSPSDCLTSLLDSLKSGSYYGVIRARIQFKAHGIHLTKINLPCSKHFHPRRCHSSS